MKPDDDLLWTGPFTGPNVAPWAALLQTTLGLGVLFLGASVRGYGSGATAWLIGGGVLFSAGGWLAYYGRVALFGRFLRHPPLRTGWTGGVIVAMSYGLMALGTAAVSVAAVAGRP